ncbi:amidophosphoribosyltransferase [Candidatus Epulonipiscium fishelsonii]|uniref:Amidophosphoribosyltransferase n=1 Tax=Candidatus Epulonipiscium fishelsonii TaxID=77094 RepID=A0ACC8X8R2_9FIRM|nr:amidophosphoribosyltransferase [Epulopiscium sp. SCG-D08WGA-EpuloA1]OON92518.1 MAG: amidophosphoribosyltransferase [Epulopiscium sp. AS2M-Bin002]
MSKLKEECGIFGIYDWGENSQVAYDTYLALYALQHRGQDSAGIAVNDKGVMKIYKDLGLVPDVFSQQNLEKLGQGQIAIGHARYATTGYLSRENAQPLLINHIKGTLAVAHNGNLTNASELKENLELGGAIFHTTNDTEVISYMITKERLKSSDIETAIENVLYTLRGAYSLVIMSPKKLIAARDPWGFRPLCIGKSDSKIVFASESCALDTIGAKFIRDVKPGEIVVVEKDNIRSIETHCKSKGNMCVFEYIYFARPDSVIEGANVSKARKQAGKYLAIEHPVDADIVMGVPDSGLDAALGYSQYSNIPYDVGYIKNRYIGRTFIQDNQKQRENSVRIKLNVIKEVVKDKRIILVDDSIVRGTTIGRIVNLLREAGAKEVHVRISAPPFISPCYFGTDIDSKENLIACKMSVEEIKNSIGADSLGYLSIENVKRIAQGASCDFCVGCFSGQYPIEAPKDIRKNKFEMPINI